MASYPYWSRRRTVAIAVGSAGRELLSTAPAGSIVVAGELRHHDALTAERMGLDVVLLGHWASERPVLRRLARELRKRCRRANEPVPQFIISRRDRCPFALV